MCHFCRELHVHSDRHARSVKLSYTHEFLFCWPSKQERTPGIWDFHSDGLEESSLRRYAAV